MNTLRVTNTPNSAAVREPLYCAPQGPLVNGDPPLTATVVRVSDRLQATREPDASRACRFNPGFGVSLSNVSHPDLERGAPRCSPQNLGALLLQDGNGTAISAQIWKDRPGAATARIEVRSCHSVMVYFFRLLVGDRVESSTLLTELERRIAALYSRGRLGNCAADQTSELSVGPESNNPPILTNPPESNGIDVQSACWGSNGRHTFD
jgi:hypothetical protein